MKKTIFMIVLMLCVQIINASANNPAESIVTTENPDDTLKKLYNDFYLFDYEGKTYIFDKEGDISPQIYNETVDDFFFGNEMGNATSYKKINDIYMAIYNQASYEKVFAGGDSWKGYGKFYVRFYDSQLNLLSETNLKSYISDYGYHNGRYYCKLLTGAGTKYYVTNNMVEWEQTEIVIINDIRNIDEIYYTEDTVSLDNRKTFQKILYESHDLNGQFGINTDVPIILSFIPDMINGKLNCYVSKDKINYIKIPLDSLLEKDELIKYNGYSPISCWYFINDNLVVESRSGKKQVILRENINKLDKMPRIKLRDTFLAFEQPPIIQNERTLIPIRFLFEQMGAEVTWNGEEQTATISQDNTAVTFAIDDTEADVNGQTVSMEIPAQLINDKTMVPVRFLSEALGYTVNWDGDTRIITID